MLRFSLTVIFTFVLTFYYVVYNPAGSCRRFLAQIGMLETMQESYADEAEAPVAPAAPPVARTPSAPLPTTGAAAGAAGGPHAPPPRPPPGGGFRQVNG
ncbi:MAG: hypothetical protein ACC661_06465, partial [Verrucomicrobiales bacterium]